ncbi:MAG: PEGA domain-containing protein [Acidobacteriota bacterium]
MNVRTGITRSRRFVFAVLLAAVVAWPAAMSAEAKTEPKVRERSPETSTSTKSRGSSSNRGSTTKSRGNTSTRSRSDSSSSTRSRSRSSSSRRGSSVRVTEPPAYGSYRGTYRGDRYRSDRYRYDRYRYRGSYYNRYRHSYRYHNYYYRWYPVYYGPYFYWDFGFPWVSSHGRYYPRYPYYSYQREYEYQGAIDFDVRPEEAEIWIDGGYVGQADDLDGFPTFLWLDEGTYDVVIYLDGYETISRQYSVYPGVVIDVEDRMKPGTATKPGELFPKTTERRDARIQRDRERAEAADWSQARRVSPDGDQTSDAPGRLRFEVEPEDAAVYLDGQLLGIAGELKFNNNGFTVTPGEHVIEISRPGYETESVTIDVESGEKVVVELTLDED